MTDLFSLIIGACLGFLVGDYNGSARQRKAITEQLIKQKVASYNSETGEVQVIDRSSEEGGKVPL